MQKSAPIARFMMCNWPPKPVPMWTACKAAPPRSSPTASKSDVRNSEPEDLVALTVEAAAIAKVLLAGTGWVLGE